MSRLERRKDIILKLVILGCTAGTLLAFSSGPPLAHTGAFGESTCIVCHSGNSLNSPGGSLSIGNVPQNYEPGQVYPIQVVISRSGQQRWGFELAVRVASNGQQAGSLTATNSTTQVTTFNGIQYISHTSAGTFQGSAQGTWTFNWTAPSTPLGPVLFAAAGNAANGNLSNSGDFIYTATATTAPAVQNPITLVFPQVAVGGGYNTVINLVNTGDSPVDGNLRLAQNDGSPMIVSFGSVQASSTPVSIPPGGFQSITAGPLNQNESTRAGWARVESSGGTPGGVATFQLVEGGALKTTVGVLSAAPLNAVTIPLNDNGSQGRYTGYAIANPGTDIANIRIILVDSSGTEVRTVQPLLLNPLIPGGYFSGFLFEDLNDPSLQFEGSMVVIADGTQAFSISALVLDRGLLTAIPVIAGKASGIGN